MFKWFAKRSEHQRKARELYGAVVAQAREPTFYRALGVADTPEGRYELIALHLVLVLDRLGQADVSSEDLRRETLETFVTDMDDSMREMGVGDVSVPKKVKKAAGGVYARGVAYRAALAASDDTALEAALIDYVGQGSREVAAKPIAQYVRRLVGDLAAQSADALRSGRVTFIPVGASHDAA
jgi:cytochrome b pre-mRNA-processing protein 3